MARPRKSKNELRKKLEIYCNEFELQAIRKKASAADLTVSQFLVRLGVGKAVRATRKDPALLAALRKAEAQLVSISRHVAQNAKPFESLQIHVQLANIERAFRDQVFATENIDSERVVDERT